MAATAGIESLVALGFTDLEARVYAHLVVEGPGTGYRIASGTGKPVANTYKAIESLERKGAVLVEDGSTRVVRAVAPEQVLSGIAKRLEKERERAAKSLKKAAKTEEDTRTYAVASEDQAVQRARQMLDGAVVVALVRGSEELRGMLRGEISDAETRGIDVAEIAGEGLTVAVDAAECLISPDGIWTRNPTIARAIFDGLSAETALGEVAARIEEGAGPKRLQRALGARRRPPVEASD